MKKSLLAAAVVAGLAGVAQAESSVTLYGVLDAGLEYGFGNGAHTFGFTQGNLAGNRVGFKGVEDLGNGTKVIFDLQAGFNITNGTSTQGGLFGRKAVVGLQDDDLGTLTAGHQKNAADALALGDVLDEAFDRFDVIGDLNVRTLQAVYVSPELSGFKVGASWGGAHAWGKNVEDDVVGDHYSAALAYAADGLEASLSYTYADLAAATTTSGIPQVSSTRAGHASAINVGLAYDFEVVKVGARYEHRVYDLVSGVRNKANYYEVSLAAPVSETGTLAFSAQFQRPEGSKENFLRLAYLEKLSKRTTAYAGIGYLTEAEAGLFAVGLNHKF